MKVKKYADAGYLKKYKFGLVMLKLDQNRV